MHSHRPQSRTRRVFRLISPSVLLLWLWHYVVTGEAMVRASGGLAWTLLLNLGSAWSYVQLSGLTPLAGVTTTHRALTMRLDSHFDRRGLLSTAALVLGGSTTGLLGKAPARAESPSLLSDEYEVTFDRSSRVGLSLADFGDR